ncbi:MAG: KEOPS complex subunit Pcc1 [Candidatus Bathycorpusculaceae bacterium]
MLEYESEEVAKAVANAVSPDNFKTPKGLSIKTVRQKNAVITKIKCRKKLPTFIATIDDLLFCTTIAEKTVQTAKKLK